MTKGIEKLLEEIRRQADEKSGQIISEAEKEVESIEADLKEKKEELRSSAEKKFNQEGELRYRQVVTEARMEIKKNHISSKAELMGRVFDEISETLSSLEGKEREMLILRLLKISVKTGKEEVLPGKREKALGSKLIKAFNDSEKWFLKLGDSTERISTGFILKAGEFETVVDMEALKEHLRESYEERVAAELFSEE